MFRNVSLGMRSFLSLFLVLVVMLLFVTWYIWLLYKIMVFVLGGSVVDVEASIKSMAKPIYDFLRADSFFTLNFILPSHT
jgi:hypothetical protein